MEPERYDDVISEALGRGAERVAQLGAVVGAAAQVIAMYKARARDEEAAEDEKMAQSLAQQRHADQEAARASWAPARDRAWLADAALLDVARAWGAAAPYADADPAAAAAVRACEVRLRELHPYAMAHYDRLRAQGAGLTEAMSQAAPLFARHPNARPHPGSSRAALTYASHAAAQPEHGVSGAVAEGLLDETATAALQRGRQILAGLDSRADAQGREPLGPGELSTVLEMLTNLPDDIIATLAAERAADLGAAGLGDAEERRGVAAERRRAADLAGATDLAATPEDERTAGLAAAAGDNAVAVAARTQAARYHGVAALQALDFPTSIEETMDAAASRGPARSAARRVLPGTGRHPGRERRPRS
jgi:hypothetical protein